MAQALQQYLFQELKAVDPDHPAVAKGSPVIQRAFAIPAGQSARGWGKKLSREMDPALRLQGPRAEITELNRQIAALNERVARYDKMLEASMVDNAANLAWKIILSEVASLGVSDHPLLTDPRLREQVDRGAKHAMNGALDAIRSKVPGAPQNPYEAVWTFARGVVATELQTAGVRRDAAPQGDVSPPAHSRQRSG